MDSGTYRNGQPSCLLYLQSMAAPTSRGSKGATLRVSAMQSKGPVCTSDDGSPQADGTRSAMAGTDQEQPVMPV